MPWHQGSGRVCKYLSHTNKYRLDTKPDLLWPNGRLLAENGSSTLKQKCAYLPILQKMKQKGSGCHSLEIKGAMTKSGGYLRMPAPIEWFDESNKRWSAGVNESTKNSILSTGNDQFFAKWAQWRSSVYKRRSQRYLRLTVIYVSTERKTMHTLSGRGLYKTGCLRTTNSKKASSRLKCIRYRGDYALDDQGARESRF